MKRYIIIMMAIILLPALSFACDICGCGAGNNYIGILPDFHKHIIGLRYRYNAMLTHVGVGGTSTYLTTREKYNTIEAWGGWNIGKRFRLMAVLPYSINSKTNQDVVKVRSGLGDISLSGFYQLLNKRSPVGNKLLVQSLWIGGGIKLATGQYNPADKSASGQNTNLFQLGTGSYDFNISAMYDIRLQDAGININSAYKINTANRHDYQYGNKFNFNTQAYYKFRVKKKWMVAPNAGIQYETSQTDRDGNIQVTVSGGNVLLGTLGVETVIGKMAIGANYQTPISQQLANGIVKAQSRLMLHVSFAL